MGEKLKRYLAAGIAAAGIQAGELRSEAAPEGAKITPEKIENQGEQTLKRIQEIRYWQITHRKKTAEADPKIASEADKYSDKIIELMQARNEWLRTPYGREILLTLASIGMTGSDDGQIALISPQEIRLFSAVPEVDMELAAFQKELNQNKNNDFAAEANRAMLRWLRAKQGRPTSLHP